MELIPGLPNDIARQCLFRLHSTQLSTLSSLSKAWKSELQSPEFWRQRKQLCNNKQLILLKCRRNFICKLIVVELETSIWSELPPIPELPNGLPKTFHFVVASFKWGFVVTGAFPEDYDEDDKPFCNKVFIFDYISATWQRGADMAEGRIFVYRCTSDGDGKVYVLCKQGDYTECIMMYDVLKRKWSSRINTGRRGGDCFVGYIRRMIYQGGKIHFVDDWILEDEDTVKSVFNVTTLKWEQPEKDFLGSHFSEMCLSDDGQWYACHSGTGTLLTYKDSTWQEIGQVAQENGEKIDLLTTWKGKLVVILGRYIRIQNRNMNNCYSRRFEVRLFDSKNQEWTTLDASEELRGFVEAACSLEI